LEDVVPSLACMCCRVVPAAALPAKNSVRAGRGSFSEQDRHGRLEGWAVRAGFSHPSSRRGRQLVPMQTDAQRSPEMELGPKWRRAKAIARFWTLALACFLDGHRVYLQEQRAGAPSAMLVVRSGLDINTASCYGWRNTSIPVRRPHRSTVACAPDQSRRCRDSSRFIVRGE
jgi:hypothetical protein